MPPEEIEQLLRTQPFESFRIYLSDGSSFTIRHPEQVILTRSAVHVGVAVRDDSLIKDRVVRCALIHVNRVEPVEATAS